MARRRELFWALDIQCRGCLSLAEIDKGIRDAKAVLFSSRALQRAFCTAKDYAPAGSALGDDLIEWKEFRLLLLCLKRFHELELAFRARHAREWPPHACRVQGRLAAPA